MITRYTRAGTVVKHLHSSSSNLSTRTSVKEQTPPLYDDSAVIKWLTSPNSTPPPPVAVRLQLNPKTQSLTIQQEGTQTSHPLPPPLLKLAAITILRNRSFLRSARSLPPVTIEYSSPNIAKPLHMGHLRSTITGSYVKNITSSAGHETRSVCFLGDWGRQFGVLHAGVQNKMTETKNEHFKPYVSSLSLHELLSTYVLSSSRCAENKEFESEALRLSADLEQTFNTDSDGAYLWSHTKTTTIDHLKSCYSVLGISFDAFEGESTYKRDSDETTKALERLETLNLTYRHDDGSLRIKTGGPHDSVLLKRDNSSVYLLRDIACALNRYEERNTHKFVYVVDDGQSSHFRNLFKILSSMGLQETTTSPDPPFTQTFTHVPFGKVKGMSTRSGNFTLLSDVIDQGTTIMHESRKKSPNARNTHDLDVSRNLAVSGLIVNALKGRRTKTYAFDWNEALRSNGNSGVALQYTIARLGSLIRRVTDGDHVEDQHVEKRINCLLECGRSDVIDLLFCIINFEDTFWRSYTSLEPCALVSYAFNLADKISKVLSTVRILDEKNKDFADAMIWIFYVSKLTLQKSLQIIGVRPVGEF